MSEGHRELTHFLEALVCRVMAPGSGSTRGGGVPDFESGVLDQTIDRLLRKHCWKVDGMDSHRAALRPARCPLGRRLPDRTQHHAPPTNRSRDLVLLHLHALLGAADSAVGVGLFAGRGQLEGEGSFLA